MEPELFVFFRRLCIRRQEFLQQNRRGSTIELRRVLRTIPPPRTLSEARIKNYRRAVLKGEYYYNRRRRKLYKKRRVRGRPSWWRIFDEDGALEIIRTIHLRAHRGRDAIETILREKRIHIPNVRERIATIIRRCPQCSTTSRTNSSYTPLRPIRYDNFGSHWEFDYFQYARFQCLLAIDGFSKIVSVWVNLFQSGEDYRRFVDALRRRYRRIGGIQKVHTDNGGPFTSRESIEHIRRLGIERARSLPRNPRCLGLAERANQTIKRGIQNELLSRNLHPNLISLEQMRAVVDRVVERYNESPHSSLPRFYPPQRVIRVLTEGTLNEANTLRVRIRATQRQRARKMVSDFRKKMERKRRNVLRVGDLCQSDRHHPNHRLSRTITRWGDVCRVTSVSRSNRVGVEYLFPSIRRRPRFCLPSRLKRIPNDDYDQGRFAGSHLDFLRQFDGTPLPGRSQQRRRTSQSSSISTPSPPAPPGQVTTRNATSSRSTSQTGERSSSISTSPPPAPPGQVTSRNATSSRSTSQTGERSSSISTSPPPAPPGQVTSRNATSSRSTSQTGERSSSISTSPPPAPPTQVTSRNATSSRSTSQTGASSMNETSGTNSNSTGNGSIGSSFRTLSPSDMPPLGTQIEPSFDEESEDDDDEHDDERERRRGVRIGSHLYTSNASRSVLYRGSQRGRVRETSPEVTESSQNISSNTGGTCFVCFGGGAVISIGSGLFLCSSCQRSRSGLLSRTREMSSTNANIASSRNTTSSFIPPRPPVSSERSGSITTSASRNRISSSRNTSNSAPPPPVSSERSGSITTSASRNRISSSRNTSNSAPPPPVSSERSGSITTSASLNRISSSRNAVSSERIRRGTISDYPPPLEIPLESDLEDEDEEEDEEDNSRSRTISSSRNTVSERTRTITSDPPPLESGSEDDNRRIGTTLYPIDISDDEDELPDDEDELPLRLESDEDEDIWEVHPNRRRTGESDGRAEPASGSRTSPIDVDEPNSVSVFSQQLRILRDIQGNSTSRRRGTILMPRDYDRLVNEYHLQEGDKDDKCPICLEDLSSNADDLVILPCQHKFHGTTCVKPWLCNHDSRCPICRGKVDLSIANATSSTSQVIEEIVEQLVQDEPTGCLDREILVEELRRRNLDLLSPTQGDGNCLFTGAIESSNDSLDDRRLLYTHQTLRQAVTRWLRQNEFAVLPNGAVLAEFGAEDDETFDDMLERIGTVGEDVGNFAVIGLANVLNTEILVWNVNNEGEMATQPLRTLPNNSVRDTWRRSREPINLVFFFGGRGRGHYQAVGRMRERSSTPPLPEPTSTEPNSSRNTTSSVPASVSERREATIANSPNMVSSSVPPSTSRRLGVIGLVERANQAMYRVISNSSSPPETSETGERSGSTTTSFSRITTSSDLPPPPPVTNETSSTISTVTSPSSRNTTSSDLPPHTSVTRERSGSTTTSFSRITSSSDLPPPPPVTNETSSTISTVTSPSLTSSDLPPPPPVTNETSRTISTVTSPSLTSSDLPPPPPVTNETSSTISTVTSPSLTSSDLPPPPPVTNETSSTISTVTSPSLTSSDLPPPPPVTNETSSTISTVTSPSLTSSDHPPPPPVTNETSSTISTVTSPISRNTTSSDLPPHTSVTRERSGSTTTSFSRNTTIPRNSASHNSTIDRTTTRRKRKKRGSFIDGNHEEEEEDGEYEPDEDEDDDDEISEEELNLEDLSWIQSGRKRDERSFSQRERRMKRRKKISNECYNCFNEGEVCDECRRRNENESSEDGD